MESSKAPSHTRKGICRVCKINIKEKNYKHHLAIQHPSEDSTDLSWANDPSIKSYFSVAKKVKRDDTQQTDPGGGGVQQAGDKDEGRQDIQEPDGEGGVRGNGTSLFDGTPLRSEVEEKSIAIGGRRKTRQPSRAK